MIFLKKKKKRLLPQCHAEFPTLQTPSWISCTISFKLPQFYCSRRHCFRKYPWCSPLLIAGKTFPFPLLWLAYVFWLAIHQVVNPVSGNTWFNSLKYIVMLLGAPLLNFMTSVFLYSLFLLDDFPSLLLTPCANLSNTCFLKMSILSLLLFFILQLLPGQHDFLPDFD